MLDGLLNFMAGYLRVECENAVFLSLVNQMARIGIRYRDLSERDGMSSFTLSERDYNRLLALEGADGCRVTKRGGIPYILHRYRKRYGLLLGLIIFAMLTWQSTLYVWDITVEGNRTVSDSEVINTLSELGFSVGSRIGATDFYGICHRFILKNDNVAWISVNMEGTSARVKVLEKSKRGDGLGNGTPSNIVASLGGVVVRTESTSGELCVKAGDVISEGQLLISGVVEVGHGENTGRFVLTRSEGKIFAQTKRVFSFSVALSGVKTEVTDRILVKKTLIFFGKSIKIKENSSILSEECDIIREERRIVLFEGIRDGAEIPLPATLTEEYMLVKKETEFSRTDEEALELAEKELSLLYSSALKDAELVSKNVESSVENGVLTLIWEVECIEDIGRETPIGLV